MLRPEPAREDPRLDAHRWNDGSQAVPASDEAAISLPAPSPAAAEDSENSENSKVEGEQAAAEDSEAEEEHEQSGAAERAWRETLLSDAATRLRPGGIDQRGRVNLNMSSSSVRDVFITSQSPDVLATPEHHRPIVDCQPVLSHELHLVTHAYVPPEEYKYAAHVLERYGLLVLQAPRRSGKRTTALHLLCGDAQASEVSEWPARGLDLALLRERIRPDRRYLIDGLEPDALAEDGQISPFGFRVLAHDLATRRSRLVITVHSDLSDTSQERLDYLVPLETLPNPEEVLRVHVQAHLSRPLAQRDAELLRDPLVGARLAAAELAEVARLAEQLALGIKDGSDLSRVLESRADIARKSAQQLLGEAVDVGRCALLLAVSVLGGTTDTIVFHEAAQLEGILSCDIPPQSPQPWRLDSTRSDRLRSIKASVHSGTERRRKFGSSRVDTVDFDDSELASQVLDVAWREHLALREPLLKWLKDLESRNRSYEIRGKTAAAVAKLATISFNQVLEHVIDGWAKANNARTRELAGEALALTAVSRIHANPVFRLLSNWVAHRSVHHRIVATVAYQWLSKRGYAPEAVNGLGRLIARHVGRSRDEQLDRQLDRAIGNALTEMLKVAPTPTLQRLVLLSEPGEPPSSQRRALRAFLHLASQWSADPARPLLVQFWQDEPETHDPIVALWARTLQSGSLRASGVAMLQRWHHQARRTTVEAVLNDVVWRIVTWQRATAAPMTDRRRRP